MTLLASICIAPAGKEIISSVSSTMLRLLVELEEKKKRRKKSQHFINKSISFLLSKRSGQKHVI
jgi:hypothetical protein